MTDPDRILITGGTGFVAGHCIAQALAAGWQVRTTVRDLARESAVRAAVGQLTSAGHTHGNGTAPERPFRDALDTGRLEVVAADLISDEGWAAAARECEYVLHVASPFPAVAVKDDAELIRPARDGALRVLQAAADAGVKRVVMTSSTAAVAYGHGGRDEPFTEADWSDETNTSDTSSYERSKTVAERAAWDWVARSGGSLQLATVCPGAILGPVAGSDRSASLGIVSTLLDGAVPGLARFGWPLVDVRDVADLHLRAMQSPDAAGQRYIAADAFAWMSEVADILREQVPDLAARVPKRKLPSALVRTSALANRALRARLYELDKHRPVTAAKAHRELGWTPRSNRDTVVATARSLAWAAAA